VDSRLFGGCHRRDRDERERNPMMKRILVFFQNLSGLVAVLSFFGVFVSIFVNKDYCAVFFSLFFLLLGLSSFLNLFTKSFKDGKSNPALIILMLGLGLVVGHFALQDLSSRTVYTLPLSRNQDTFSGDVVVPGDVALSDKPHTFFIEVRHSGRRKRSIQWASLSLKFDGPDTNYATGLSVGKCKGICDSRLKVKHTFIPQSGTYTFSISITKKSHLSKRIHSIKVLLREKKR